MTLLEKSDVQLTDVEQKIPSRSLNQMRSDAFTGIEDMAHKAVIGLILTTLCIFVIWVLAVVVRDWSLWKFLGGSVVGVLTLLILIPTIEHMPKVKRIQQWALAREIPKELMNAPSTAEGLLDSMVKNANIQRELMFRRPMMKVEFVQQPNFRNFADGVDFHDVEIFYNFGPYETQLDVMEMMEDVLHIQADWDPIRELVTSATLSIVCFTESGRTMKYLDIEEDGTILYGTNTDTISLGDIHFPDEIAYHTDNSTLELPQ